MKPVRTPLISLRIAVAYVGSQIELARAIGVTPVCVSKWMRRGYASPAYAKVISAVTGGDVTVEELIPDLK